MTSNDVAQMLFNIDYKDCNFEQKQAVNDYVTKNLV